MIEFDCTIVVALHLGLIGVLQNFPSVRKGLLIHGPIVTTRDACCLRYGSPKRSESSPVLPDGSTGSMEQEMCESMQKDCNFRHQIERIKGFRVRTYKP